MSKPTLLIGLGTAGLKALEHTQHYYQETTGKEKPDNVAYLYIETDENSKPASSLQRKHIKSCFISLKDKSTTVNNIKERTDTTKWIPDIKILKNEGKAGAGGIPAYGRICLWDNQNYAEVRSKITYTHQEISQQANEEPTVFIVGSLAGGTGSGTFIDMAYIVKDIFSNTDEVYGVFMIPGKEKYHMDAIMYNNYLSALKGLDYYNQKDTSFDFQFTSGVKLHKNTEPPFDLSMIVSQDYDENLPSLTYNGLCKITGLFLFLNILGLKGIRKSSLVDSQAKHYIDKYATFGISAIQYPKSQLQELLAVNLSIELLERWGDNEGYINKQGRKTPLDKDRAKIHRERAIKFSELLNSTLTEWSQSIETGENNSIDEDINAQAYKIAKKQVDPRKHLISQYHSETSGNYYHLLNSNIDYPKDRIIEEINNWIREDLEEYQNLHVIKIILESILEAIKKTISYWKSIGVSSRQEDWYKTLKKYSPWVLKNSFPLLLERQNLIEDRMHTLLDMMKMHIFSDILVKIGKDIKTNEFKLETTEKQVKLPNISYIDKLIDALTKTNGKKKPDAGEKEIFLLTNRAEELKADLNDSSIPTIYKIFRTGKLETEIKDIEDNYKRKTSRDHPGKSDITEKYLWDYFQDIPNNQLSSEIYGDTIDKFQNRIIQVQAVENYDVKNFVENEIEETKHYALRATYPLIRVNPDEQAKFKHVEGIPRVVIGNSQPMIKNVIDNLRRNNMLEFSYENESRDTFVDENINNIILFYKEFGHMTNNMPFDVLAHLREIDMLEELFAKQGEREIRGGKISSFNEWHSLRAPYIDYDNLQKTYQLHYSEGLKYEKELKYEEAKKFFLRAKRVKYGDEEAGHKTKRIKDTLNEETHNERLNRYTDIANSAYNKGKLITARNYYAKILKTEPNDINASQKIQDIRNKIEYYNSEILQIKEDMKQAQPDELIKMKDRLEVIQKEYPEAEGIEDTINQIERMLKNQ